MPTQAYSHGLLSLLFSLKALSEAVGASHRKAKTEELMLPSPRLQLPRDQCPRIRAPGPFCKWLVDTSVMYCGETLPQSLRSLSPIF